MSRFSGRGRVVAAGRTALALAVFMVGAAAVAVVADTHDANARHTAVRVLSPDAVHAAGSTQRTPRLAPAPAKRFVGHLAAAADRRTALSAVVFSVPAPGVAMSGPRRTAVVVAPRGPPGDVGL